MKALYTLGFSVLAGIALSFPVRMYPQDSNLDVHPAKGLEVANIVVTVSSRLDKHHPKAAVIMDRSDAVGFTAGDCGVVTTFDVVQKYEEWSYRPDVTEDIDVIIGGTHYEGSLRPLGVYPLGLDLACIDLSPRSPGGKVVTFPLVAKAELATLTIEDVMDLSKPGTPLLNKKGEVVAVFVGNDFEKEESVFGFVSGGSLNKFLAAAAEVSHSQQRFSLEALR